MEIEDGVGFRRQAPEGGFSRKPRLNRADEHTDEDDRCPIKCILLL